jgi:hypothetical protein
MKKNFTLFTFYFFLPLLCNMQRVTAQNLVPNPSFEIYDTCPNGQCQVIYATGWEIYSLTPDYFNACASTWSVPKNPAGYQLAASGNGYTGIYCGGPDYTEREYFGTTLTSPLIIGKQYQIKMKVVSTEKSIQGYFCNNLGVLFSTVSYAYPCDQLIPNLLPQNFAHIYSSDIISDTVNWVTISGILTADSAYSYLIIGNFFDNANTQFSAFDSTGFGAYYFLDDIEVYPDTILDTTLINAQNILSNIVSVFPNPANDKIYYKNDRKSSLSILLYNQYGIFIKEQIIEKSEQFVSTHDIPNGIYFLQIHSSDFTLNKKIIIQH